MSVFALQKCCELHQLSPLWPHCVPCLGAARPQFRPYLHLLNSRHRSKQAHQGGWCLSLSAQSGPVQLIRTWECNVPGHGRENGFLDMLNENAWEQFVIGPTRGRVSLDQQCVGLRGCLGMQTLLSWATVIMHQYVSLCMSREECQANLKHKNPRLSKGRSSLRCGGYLERGWKGR